MKRGLGILAGLAAMLATTACLQKETTHRLYLSPAGAVVWTVQEADVRSDEADRGRRLSEEQEFLAGVHADRHPVAVALRQIGGAASRTRLRRGERPFEVYTEGHFARVEDLVRAILVEMNVPGDVTIERNGTRTALAVRIDPAASAGHEYDGPLLALVEDLSRYQIVLTRGRSSQPRASRCRGTAGLQRRLRSVRRHRARLCSWR